MRRRTWAVLAGLTFLVLAVVLFLRTPSDPSRRDVESKLWLGMTPAQAERALGLSVGTLRLDLPEPKVEYHATLREAGWMSLFTPRPHITLIFDKKKRLKQAWWELVFIVDEVEEGPITLRAAPPQLKRP